MRFPKADKSNENESFEDHESYNPGDMVTFIKPRNEFTFIEMVANAWCYILFVVLEVASEIEDDKEVHDH